MAQRKRKVTLRLRPVEADLLLRLIAWNAEDGDYFGQLALFDARRQRVAGKLRGALKHLQDK